MNKTQKISHGRSAFQRRQSTEGCPMTTTVIDEYILPTLVRYRDRYQWRWNICMRIINRYYGTAYTEKELKQLYRQHK